jgi:hypothetical protein
MRRLARWAALAVVLAASLPGVAAVTVGPPEQLHDNAAAPLATGRGDGFSAWVDASGAAPQVAVHLDATDSVYALTKSESGTAIDGLAVYGHWIAWSQQSLAAKLPGEAQRRTTWDVRVYDMDRRSVVFDTATGDRNETSPALGPSQVAFLDDRGGAYHVALADLRGPNAFLPLRVRPAAGLQTAPALAGDTVAFTEVTPQGPQVVRVTGGVATVLAPPAAGRGYGAVAGWDGHLAWVAYAGGRSDVRLTDAAGTALGNWSWPGTGVAHLAGEGDAVVAERLDGARALWAWCVGEAPAKVPTSGSALFPSLAQGRLVYLALSNSVLLPQQRALSCGGASAGGSAGSPMPALPLGALLMLLLAATRRR